MKKIFTYNHSSLDYIIDLCYEYQTLLIKHRCIMPFNGYSCLSSKYNKTKSHIKTTNLSLKVLLVEDSSRLTYE